MEELYSDRFIFLMGAMPLFIIPSKSRPGKPVLEWKKAIEEIPWDLILLIGGGVAVAEAFKVTNTSDYIASFFCCSSLFSSNTATTTILVPIPNLPFFAVLVIVGLIYNLQSFGSVSLRFD